MCVCVSLQVYEYDLVVHQYQHTGENKVFEVLVRELSNIYQAGSCLVFLRVSQGSAVISTKTQNGMCTHSE